MCRLSLPVTVDLEQMAQAGSFRSDLYHRLSVFRVNLPPLREAVEDLDELVPLFVAEYNAKAGRQVKDIPDDVWKNLRRITGRVMSGSYVMSLNAVYYFLMAQHFPDSGCNCLDNLPKQDQWKEIKKYRVSMIPTLSQKQVNRAFICL